MLLREIVKDFPTKEKFDGEIEINQVEFEPDKVKDNCLFICLKQDFETAEEYIQKAISHGAKAVVTSLVGLEKLGAEAVCVDDIRMAFSVFCSNFYQNPENKLKIIGVVGTNGKTSTCKILQHILNSAGKRTAYIGTLGIHFENFNIEQELTTPDPTLLFSTLNKLVELGAEYVTIEYSAHAIFYKKLSCINFEALIFTNCTQDHLDFFKDFQSYENVKAFPFKTKACKNAIINVDDGLGLKLYLSQGGLSYGIENPSDVFAVNIKEISSGTSYVVNLFDKILKVNCKLLGRFNVYNSLGASTCAKVLGVDEKVIASSLNSLEPISGRMEKVAEIFGASVYVDYAHTPDGLEKSLISARNVTKKNLYCVFGCGGNRDKEKRPIMGRIAGDICDFVVITSDNPRFEDGMKIICDIERGVRESTRDYICIQSREKAIIYALKNLEKGDTLLIAGKGSENYQDILGVKHEFSDKRVVLDFIGND